MESKRIKPILTPWSNKVILKEWTTPAKSGTMVGTKYWVRYINSKGKEVDFMKWVKWDL